jgi:hypothetical protein
MARSRYSDHATKERRDGTKSRDEYLLTARAEAKRGTELPQTKLLALDIGEIRSAARQREKLKTYIRENLGNAALAKKFGVHERTIEKVLSYETAGHIP